MNNEKVKTIPFVGVIKKIGYGLQQLMKRGNGNLYFMQLDRCSDFGDFIHIINRILLEYLTTYNKYLIEEDDLDQLMDLITEDKDLKPLINFMLIYATISRA